MVNPEPFQLPREEVINRLQKENDWYNKKYGPYIGKRGVHNWKNLFRRPNILEWTILIMLLMALFMGWAYYRDFKVYEQNIKENCCEICSFQKAYLIENSQVSLFINKSSIFNEENSKEEEII